MARINARIRDYSDEYSSVSANVDGLVALDTWSAATDAADGFEAAIEGLTLGTVVKVEYAQATAENADERPASPYAQRELAVRFFFFDPTTNEKGYISIPAPDLANIDMLAGTDLLDLTDTEAAAMVTWIEANVEINAGQLVTVDRAVVVGRSS